MTQPIQRILVPTDFSEHSRRAMEYALSLAQRMGASVDLLHVWEPPVHIAPDALMMMPGWEDSSVEKYGLAHAGHQLHHWAEPYTSGLVPVQVRLERGIPADTILRTAERGYDLVVMGTRGRTGLARLLMGSVAQKVSARASCPVMTVRGPEAEEEARPSG
jgi:nucleotide-binding universal stress UspA family protein